MTYSIKKGMGDAKPMAFEDYINRFINDRGFSRGKSDQISISQGDYKDLKTKAEKYEALVEEHKKVKTQNDQLLKQLDDMKDDGRKFKELMEEKEKYLNSLLRIRADFENYKKRSERENNRFKSYVMDTMLKKLIDHYDDLVRALNLLKMLEDVDGIKKGFEIIVKNFDKILTEEGVRPMNSEGEKFDPYKHEAVIVEEGYEDLPENTILEEITKGYYLKDKILRPARVKISKKSKLKNLNEN
ncbi:MAG: nucleotide exchange factor GrpE [Candidatus Lokiarchaeota archaeon]|nr:nucleotide exchange factor GrpE [Candidatus Lokiarchaeota archaeon]